MVSLLPQSLLLGHGWRPMRPWAPGSDLFILAVGILSNVLGLFQLDLLNLHFLLILLGSALNDFHASEKEDWQEKPRFRGAFHELPLHSHGLWGSAWLTDWNIATFTFQATKWDFPEPKAGKGIHFPLSVYCEGKLTLLVLLTLSRQLMLNERHHGMVLFIFWIWKGWNQKNQHALLAV